jgi:hypothetical protein
MLPALWALRIARSLRRMQIESLAEQELMESNRLAAGLQAGHVQHQQAKESLCRLRVSQRKLRERGHQATVSSSQEIAAFTSSTIFFSTAGLHS